MQNIKKKTYVYLFTLLLLFLLIIIALTWYSDNQTENMENLPSIELSEQDFLEQSLSEEALFPETTNPWVLESEETIQDLNLDGVGNKDDFVTMNAYVDCNDTRNAYSQLSIVLGSGEQLIRNFAGRTDSIQITHGDLFKTKTDALIIRIGTFGSNYGAADIYVCHLVKNNKGFEIVDSFVLLDSNQENDSRKDKSSCFYQFKDENIFWGEVCYIEELKLDGVHIKFFGRENIPFVILYWSNTKWEIFETGNE